MPAIPSGLGPVMPMNAAASEVTRSEDMYAHLRNIDYSRGPDFRTAPTMLDIERQYDSMLDAAREGAAAYRRSVEEDAARRAENTSYKPNAQAPGTSIAESRIVALERQLALQDATLKRVLAQFADLKSELRVALEEIAAAKSGACPNCGDIA
jgi:hypothetical protein